MVTKHQAEERDELEKMLSQKELKLEDLRNSQPIYTVKNVSVLWSLVRLLVLSKMSMDLFGPCPMVFGRTKYQGHFGVDQMSYG